MTATHDIEASRRRHLRTLVLLFAALAIAQTLIGYGATVRSLQYYSRICFLIEINIILTVSLSLINGFTGQFSIFEARY